MRALGAPVAVLACVAWWGMPSLARADQPPELGFRPDAQREARARAYAADIERHLASLPGVKSVHAHVELPSPFAAALDAPPPRARAHVLLEARPEADLPDAAALARQAAWKAPQLAASDVTVERRRAPRPAAPPYVRVGPFEASPRSAPWLRATLAALLATTLLLGALLMRYARKRL